MASLGDNLSLHLEKLRTFSMAAQVGSIRRASTALRISQPALTRSIHALEKALGLKLLVRASQGVKPTPEGKEVLALFAAITRELQTAERRLLQQRTSTPLLQIGTYHSIATHQLPTALAKMRESRAPLEVTVRTADMLELLHLLSEAELDVLILQKLPPTLMKADWIETRLYHEELVWAFPKSAEGLPVATAPDAMIASKLRLRDALLTLAAPPHIAFRVDHFEAAKAFAMAGVASAIIPKSTLSETDLARLGRVSVLKSRNGEAVGHHEIVALYRSELRGNPAVKSLLSALSKARRGELDRAQSLRRAP